MERAKVPVGVRYILAAFLVMGAISACASMDDQSSTPFQTNPSVGQTNSGALQNNQGGSTAAPGNSQYSAPAPHSNVFSGEPRGGDAAPVVGPTHSEFPDIALPGEMEVDNDDSFIVQSGAQKIGILVIRGRVDSRSLVGFFQAGMPRDGWKPRGGFQYMRSVLVYEKSGKICIINVFEKAYYTYAEIYVSPTN